MSRREDQVPNLDALLRRAAVADPPPPDLEARVRARLDGEPAVASPPRRRSPVFARLAAAGGLAAAASVALLLLRPPAGPPAPSEPDAPFAEPERPRVMRAAGPAVAGAPPRARVLDTRGAIPVSLETTDPSITIVWMLPGSDDEKTELH